MVNVLVGIETYETRIESTLFTSDGQYGFTHLFSKAVFKAQLTTRCHSKNMWSDRNQLSKYNHIMQVFLCQLEGPSTTSGQNTALYMY